MKKVWLLVILVISFLLRILLISFGLPSKNLALTTYNPDEPLSYYTIEKWQPRKLDFHPRRVFLWGGFHLYPLAGFLGVAKIFRFVKLGNREFYIKNLVEADKLYLVGRGMMIVFGVLSVWVIFLILKNTYGDKIALLGSVLLSILPAHIFNSIYVRPDVVMLFFVFLAIYFSIKLVKTQETKFYILSCFAVGFATGAKLSGAVYGILPVIAHFLSNGNFKRKFFDIKLYLIPLLCLLFFCFSSPYVILDFDKTEESFLHYLKINFSLSKGTMSIGQDVLYGSGILSYIKYYLPVGYGVAVVLLSVIGFCVMLWNVIKEKNKFDILFFISGIIVMLVVSSTKNQVVWYTLPVIPFLVIWAVRGLQIIYNKGKVGRYISLVVGVLTVFYTMVYSFSYWKLYYEKNVREEASEWIEKNVPKGSKIAIARSYFWTPAVLRQYNPPYEVLEGRDATDSGAFDGLKGLENVLDKAEYVVLTEYEFRDVLHPKIKNYFLDQQKVAYEIFESGNFIKVAEFDKEAKFLGIKFKKNYPPTDWLIPNPKIVVFKNNSLLRSNDK